jgi:hypothetical protein
MKVMQVYTAWISAALCEVQSEHYSEIEKMFNFYNDDII